MNHHNAPHGTRQDHNVWPGLSSPDPLALRRWLSGLGFEEGGCYLDEENPSIVIHSEMLWPEGGRVMISSAAKQGPFRTPPGTGNLYVVTADPEAVQARALALGAGLLRELGEEDYGSRGFSVSDPDGNAWSFGTYAG